MIRASAPASVPITAATTTSEPGLTDAWGVRAGWLSARSDRPLQLPLASGVGYAR